MWVRQCDLDAEAEAPSPIPTRIASNEEFIPPPQNAEQKAFEARLAEISERNAKKQGLSRRAFLRTGSGMAAALLALNEVFGHCYEVVGRRGRRTRRPSRRNGPRTSSSSTCRRTTSTSAASGTTTPPTARPRCASSACCGRSPGDLDESLEQLNRAHYVKEVFGDSDTVMAIISGVPSRDWDKNPLPPDQMVATRKYVNDLAGSQRVLSHGLLRPNLGKKELEEMERQVKELKIDAWKMYTGAELGEKAWFMDDEKVAYPFWEKTQEARHQEPVRPQGAAAGRLQREGLHAARPGEGGQGLARPELHRLPLRLPRHRLARPAAPASKVEDPKTDDPQEIPWISDILRILKKNPKIKNIYFELGSTFQHALVPAIRRRACTCSAR